VKALKEELGVEQTRLDEANRALAAATARASRWEAQCLLNEKDVDDANNRVLVAERWARESKTKADEAQKQIAVLEEALTAAKALEQQQRDEAAAAPAAKDPTDAKAASEQHSAVVKVWHDRARRAEEDAEMLRAERQSLEDEIARLNRTVAHQAAVQEKAGKPNFVKVVSFRKQPSFDPTHAPTVGRRPSIA